MVLSLYDNINMAAAQDSGTFGSTSENSSNFTPAVNGQITKLRWYRRATGGTRVPGRLDLWDTYTQQVIASTAAPPDNGGVGWQDFTLTAPLDVTAGRPLKVALTTYNGFVAAQLPSANWVASSTDLPWDATRFNQSFGAVPVYPGAGGTNAQTYCVDVVFSPGTSGGNPLPTPGTITNDLTAWLADTSDNTHRDASAVPGLPDRTYQDAHTTKQLAQGATGFDAIKAVADAISAAVGGLPGTIASAVTTITGQVISSAAGITGAGLRTISEVYDNTTTLLSHIADLMAGTSPASGSTTGRAPFPTGLWTFVDSSTFSGPLAWAVAADLYVVDVTTIPPNRPTTLGDGAPWTPRLGWWCQMNGTFFGERHFFDFPSSHLQDGGRRMPGVLIWPEDGAAGTIQAWVYS